MGDTNSEVSLSPSVLETICLAPCPPAGGESGRKTTIVKTNLQLVIVPNKRVQPYTTINRGSQPRLLLLPMVSVPGLPCQEQIENHKEIKETNCCCLLLPSHKIVSFVFVPPAVFSKLLYDSCQLSFRPCYFQIFACIYICKLLYYSG